MILSYQAVARDVFDPDQVELNTHSTNGLHLLKGKSSTSTVTTWSQSVQRKVVSSGSAANLGAMRTSVIAPPHLQHWLRHSGIVVSASFLNMLYEAARWPTAPMRKINSTSVFLKQNA